MPDVYSDVPVAYAVFDLIFAEDGKTVQDTKYVFVNKIYCEMVGKTEEELLGNSFRSIYEKVNPIWMTYCARVCHEGRPSATASTRRRSTIGWISRSCRSRSRAMSPTRS